MDNPYATQQTDPMAAPSHQQAITPNVIQALAGTKPWIRLCSIIGFIGAGLMMLGGLGMLLGAVAMGSVLNETGANPAIGGLPFAAISIFYFLFGALYIIPSVKLWKYGTHILNLMQSQSVMDLEAALDAQRAFWKFVGIMICIVLGLYFVGIMIAVIFGALFANM